MDGTKISAIVSLILALSIASERLVEIVKGFFPWLDKSSSDPKTEGRRRSVLQILAVASGIATAMLAKDYVPPELSSATKDLWGVLGLGLLASGGSGFWNSILTYVARVKDIKNAQADAMKAPK